MRIKAWGKEKGKELCVTQSYARESWRSWDEMRKKQECCEKKEGEGESFEYQVLWATWEGKRERGGRVREREREKRVKNEEWARCAMLRQLLSLLSTKKEAKECMCVCDVRRRDERVCEGEASCLKDFFFGSSSFPEAWWLGNKTKKKKKPFFAAGQEDEACKVSRSFWQKWKWENMQTKWGFFRSLVSISPETTTHTHEHITKTLTTIVFLESRWSTQL